MLMPCMTKNVMEDTHTFQFLQIDGSEIICLHFQALTGQGLGGGAEKAQTEEAVCLGET